MSDFLRLHKIISSQHFLKMEALGGEIPFYIAPYKAEEELQNREGIKGLINKLENDGIKVLELNLYDLSCELLARNGNENNDLQRIFDAELRSTKGKRIRKNIQQQGKSRFLKALQSVLNVHEVLMPAIAQQIEQSKAQVYFLTGVGAVFPFIRSHTILNNLQSIAVNAPTVTFFPGEYDGNSLQLFGRLKDDNYYRAYDIYSIKVADS